MVEVRNYSAIETTREGRRVEIRAVRPDDRAALTEIVSRASAHSLYLRFFTVRRKFTEKQVDFFVKVDFAKQVALVSVVEEGDSASIIGGGRYVLIGAGKAEMAFFIIDEYQGQGIGSMLMRHLTAIARQSGVRELIAEVLPDNQPMLGLFRNCGLPMKTMRQDGVMHVTLDLTKA